jgi:STE24 endopeptidase
MDWHSPWFWIAALGLLAVFHLELIADFLNLSRLGGKGDLDEQEHARMTEYNIASTRLDMMRRAFSLGVLVSFWFCGGFGWLDSWSRGLGLDAVRTGVLLIAVLSLVQQLMSLPFEIWDTFGVEAKFGFNRTTPGTFIADRIKGLVIMAVIGLPILWLIVWFFETQPLAALWAWLSVAAFSVIMSFLAPRLIMPLFLKFRPLEDNDLKQAILDLSGKLSFPVGEVNVVDGSRRSTKANAFFAGFGKAKRIALFDTLLSAHDRDEILAVLAHEIGHFKRKHVIQQMVLGLAQMGLMFLLLHFAMRAPTLFHAFGVDAMSAGMGLVLFSIVYRPLSLLLDLWQSGLSRKHEFEADAYAAQAMGQPAPLMRALGRLSREHLAHPAPHPFYVALHYSHPPVAERLEALARF